MADKVQVKVSNLETLNVKVVSQCRSAIPEANKVKVKVSNLVTLNIKVVSLCHP